MFFVQLVTHTQHATKSTRSLLLLGETRETDVKSASTRTTSGFKKPFQHFRFHFINSGFCLVAERNLLGRYHLCEYQLFRKSFMAEFVLILSFKDIHYAYAYELRPIGHQTRRSGS